MHSQIRNYNFLIVGRSGAGKSATTKLLTGNPQITVANSLKQVTKQANFYEGISFPVNDHYARFRILDVPGLDRINNRFVIRQQILNILEKQKISLHGILYISSLTERDTIDNEKLFNFIEQLPWSSECKRNCLIPIFTKYDNLIIDSLDQQIRSTKAQYKEMFDKAGYSTAWSKRVYWINHTKSLDFKMKTYEQIKITHEKQIQRLIEMIHRTKVTLTMDDIKVSIDKEQRYILQKLFQKMTIKNMPFRIEQKKYSLTAKIQIQHKKVHESVTALSASSIGLFIAKVLKKQIPTFYTMALIGLPIAIALLNMKGITSVLHGKKVSQQSSGVQLLQTFQRLCHMINLQVQNQWKQLNSMMDIRTGEKNLYCIIKTQKTFKFIDIQNLIISMNDQPFQLVQNQQCFLNSNQTWQKPFQSLVNLNKYQRKYRIKMPKFQMPIIWEPVLEIQYGVRIFDQESILKEIQLLRQQFYNHAFQK